MLKSYKTEINPTKIDIRNKDNQMENKIWKDRCWKIQQWVNNRIIFRSCVRFEEFDRKKKKIR